MTMRAELLVVYVLNQCVISCDAPVTDKRPGCHV